MLFRKPTEGTSMVGYQLLNKHYSFSLTIVCVTTDNKTPGNRLPTANRLNILRGV